MPEIGLLLDCGEVFLGERDLAASGNCSREKCPGEMRNFAIHESIIFDLVRRAIETVYLEKCRSLPGSLSPAGHDKCLFSAGLAAAQSGEQSIKPAGPAVLQRRSRQT